MRNGTVRRPSRTPAASPVGPTFKVLGKHSSFSDEFPKCKEFCVTVIIRMGDQKLKSNTCKVNRNDDKKEYDPFEDADAFHERVRARAKFLKERAERERQQPKPPLPEDPNK